MTFADPYLLAGLVVLPLALVAYIVLALRGRRNARAAASKDLWPNLMPRRPGWRRHVPPVLLLMALALLLLGMARPQALLASDQKQTTVVLALDISRSMGATDVPPSRIAAARNAARVLVDGLPKNAKIGLVTFTRDVRVLVAPTDDRTAFSSALTSFKLGGGTALGVAVDRAIVSLKATHPSLKGRAIVVISDGASTEGKIAPDVAARTARKDGVRVFTVLLGTAGGTIKENGQTVNVPTDPTTLKRVAALSGGRFYRATDATGLRNAYKAIGSAVHPQKKRRDISVAFIGGAMALVAGGSLLSLAWFRRLI